MKITLSYYGGSGYRKVPVKSIEVKYIDQMVAAIIYFRENSKDLCGFHSSSVYIDVDGLTAAFFREVIEHKMENQPTLIRTLIPTLFF